MIRALQCGLDKQIEKYSNLEITKAALIQHTPVDDVYEEVTNVRATNVRATNVRATKSEDLTKLQQLTSMLEQMDISDYIAPP
tara:strand:- start:8315 stop:8563 length:249 start_codon:yes stop_codon:yes gene_type:complete